MMVTSKSPNPTRVNAVRLLRKMASRALEASEFLERQFRMASGNTRLAGTRRLAISAGGHWHPARKPLRAQPAEERHQGPIGSCDDEEQSGFHETPRRTAGRERCGVGLRLAYRVVQVGNADARDHRRVAKNGWRAGEVVDGGGFGLVHGAFDAVGHEVDSRVGSRSS